MLIGLLKFFSFLAGTLGMVGLALIIPLVGLAGMIIFRSREETDQKKRRRVEKFAYWVVMVPFLLIVGAVFIQLILSLWERY